MEEGIETSEKQNGFEGEGGTALRAGTDTLPTPEFVKVEKNLASLGFFTPSSKRLHNAQEKSFTITTTDNGQRIELKGSIIPSAKYGLPVTADQDKWIALCKIISDIVRKEGRVTNPVAFSSAEILRLLHKHRHSGKNYREIEEWLDVLFSTTIISEGVVYLAHEKRRVKDRFRVFDRVVSFGKELSNGEVADKNYAWLSEWQLQNINSNHLLPIDLDAYRDLKNHIAKALVPLLQIWLYATRKDGVFEKRYNELCEFLNIQKYPYRSLILRTLGPSLDELKHFGYLSDWRLQRTTDDESYKIVFYHGAKFHRDRRARLKRSQADDATGDRDSHQQSLAAPTASRVNSSRKDSTDQVPKSITTASFDPQLVTEFTRRGIAEKKTVELLANLKPGQDVLAQLELIDGIVAHPANKVINPPGFYVRLIEANTPIPDGFETSATRKIREKREKGDRERRAAEEVRQELEWEYENYCESEIDCYITANGAAFEALKDAKWKEDRERFSFTTESMARLAARHQIRKQVHFLTFEEFTTCKKQGTDFSMKLVAVSPAPNSVAIEPIAQEVVAISEASALVPDLPVSALPEAKIEESSEPAIQPATPEPPIADLALLLIPDPSRQEPGGNAAEEGIA
jgi:hypothetical protein